MSDGHFSVHIRLRTWIVDVGLFINELKVVGHSEMYSRPSELQLVVERRKIWHCNPQKRVNRRGGKPSAKAIIRPYGIFKGGTEDLALSLEA